MIYRQINLGGIHMIRYSWPIAFLLAGIGAVIANAQDAPFAAFALASPSELANPHDLAFGPDGRLYVADKSGARIAVLDPDTLEIVAMLGEGQFPGIHDISFSPDGLAYVSVTGSVQVDVIRITGDTITSVRKVSGFPGSAGVLPHSNGRLYIMAGGSGELVAFENDQPIAGFGGLYGALDVAESIDGTLWVAANNQSALVHLTQDLDLIEVLNGPEFGLRGPRYLDIDEFGRIIVADQDANRILLIDPLAPEGSRLLGVLGDGMPGIGPGKFNDPEGVAVRGNSFYFSDTDNDRIVKYSIVIN